MDSEFRQELVSLLPRLRRFAMNLTAHLQDADDLVQQACEKALLKQAQWRPGTRLDSWMYRIIQNQHIDTLRSSSRRGDQAPDFALDELSDPANNDVPERENMIGKVSELIATLPEEQRLVMLLVAVEDYSYREAAELLDVPVGTIMSRLARARGKIAAALGETAPAGGGR